MEVKKFIYGKEQFNYRICHQSQMKRKRDDHIEENDQKHHQSRLLENFGKISEIVK